MNEMSRIHSKNRTNQNRTENGTQSVISDAIRDELRGRDDDLTDHTIEAIAENITQALAAEGLLKA